MESNSNNIVSFKGVLKPKKCERKKCSKVGSSEKYCIDHDESLCSSCTAFHEDEGCSFVPIEDYLNVSFYLKFGDTVKQFFDSNPHLCKNTIINNIDTRNKFLYVNPDERTVHFGPKFQSVDLLAGDPFLVVSFIGNTGCGKSCTIGSLCTESDNHPIPSYTNSESTSSDINSYIGQFETEWYTSNNIDNSSDNSSIDSWSNISDLGGDFSCDANSDCNDNSKCIKKMNYLLLDSEGFGGTPPSVNVDGANSEIQREIIQYKYDWVQMGYPRLLFLISDVLVYTHGGSNREKDLIISRILGASEVSSSNPNNLFKPHLVILFTKNIIGEEFKDEDRAKSDFFSNCKKEDYEKLELLYQSVSVIYASSIDQKNGFSNYIQDIVSLKQLIATKLQASIRFKTQQNFNFNRKANLNRIRKIVNYLQQDPTSAPDLQLLNATGIKENSSFNKVFRNRSSQYDFASKTSSMDSKQHFKECIGNALSLYRYFETFYAKCVAQGNTNVDSFNMAFGSLESIILKNYKKFQKANHLHHNSIVEDYSFILAFVSKLIYERSPCQELIHGKYQCINTKESHPYHQSKELETKNNSFLKTIFGSPKSYQAPYITKGSFKSSLEKYDLSALLEIRINNNQLKKMSPDGPILDLKSDMKHCESFCVGCVARIPTIHYSCGHIICLACSKQDSKKGECIISGCNGSILNKKELDFNPAIGCRILSIDGGGIKSISQCVALGIMQEELYGIEIHELFDLVVGMNTGGFIALCLMTSKTDLDQVIELFTEFITLNTKSGQLSLKDYFDLSNDLLSKEMGNASLKDSYSKTRLFIPSLKVTEKSMDQVVLLNYDKAPNEVETHEDSITCYEAASISMIPLFLSNIIGLNLLKCYDDNPCDYAINEYNSLWGQSCKNIDVFVSLGSGVFTTKGIMDSLLSFTKESKSKILLEDLNQINKCILNKDFNTFRVNGKFMNQDSWDTIVHLQSNLNEIKSTYSNDKSLYNSINKSLSSLFYLSDLNISSSDGGRNSKLSGKINCRLKSIPTQLLDQLNEKYPKFYLQDVDESNSDFKITSKDISKSKISISFIITNPSDIVDIRCLMVSKSRSSNNTSISSCPFSIKDDLKYFINNNS